GSREARSLAAAGKGMAEPGTPLLEKAGRRRTIRRPLPGEAVPSFLVQRWLARQHPGRREGARVTGCRAGGMPQIMGRCSRAAAAGRHPTVKSLTLADYQAIESELKHRPQVYLFTVTLTCCFAQLHPYRPARCALADCGHGCVVVCEKRVLRGSFSC